MIGLHIYKSSKDKTIINAIKNQVNYAKKYNIYINTFQIFVKNPHGYDKLYDENELQEIKSFIDKNDYNLFVHSSYVSSLKLNGDHKKGIAQIKSQLKICDFIESDGLIVHLSKQNINDTIESIKLIELNDYKTKIYLENRVIIHNEDECSIELCDSIFSDECSEFNHPKQINKLYNNLKNNNINVGICIDTAHLWVSGISIKSKNDMKLYLSKLKIPNRDLLFHINDSHNELGSYKDHHDNFGSKIWGKYKQENNWEESGIYYLIKYCIKKNIPMIMESRNEKKYLDNDYIFLSQFSELNGDS